MIVAIVLPPLIAAVREHRHTTWIFFLSIFSWTIVGGLILLVWALLPLRRPPGGGVSSYDPPAR
ncbi:MAG: superinfection immunity protein [Sphingomonadales bacterium]